MTIIITAFEHSPDGGKGLARDTRIRWALEEVGQPYEVRLVSFRAMKEPAHLALHPFGQIPTYEEGDLALFETGAIVFHIAEHHAGLLPDGANARARAIVSSLAWRTSQPVGSSGAQARISTNRACWKEVIVTCFSMPCLRIKSAVRRESCGERPLISVWMCARPVYRSSTSSNAGIRSPANPAPKEEPASSRRSAASVWLVTGPEPSVVRSTVSS